MRSLFDQYKKIELYDPENWRREFLFNSEPVDIFFKKCANVFNIITPKYQQQTIGNAQCYWTVETFITLLQHMKLKQQITDEQVQINFNMSVGNNAEEMRCNDNHLKLKTDKKHELYECWARTVHDLKFPMQMDEADKQRLKLGFEQPPGKQEDQELADKLWIILPHMFNCFDYKHNGELGCISNLINEVIKKSPNR